MKRSLYICITILAILSLSQIAAGVPSGVSEKPNTAFYGTETCTLLKQGEKSIKEGWTYIIGQEWTCTLKSDDSQVAGSYTLHVRGPRHGGQEHTIVASYHMKNAYHEWVGEIYGTIAKDGTITWINGSAVAQVGPNMRHIMYLRFDGAKVNGWYVERGMQ
jgi:hypothetical protein